MSTETGQISRELMLLRGKFAGRLQELAAMLGISKQRLSAYLNGAKPTKRIDRDVLTVFAKEFPGESGPSTGAEQPPPISGKTEPAVEVTLLPNGGRMWRFTGPDADARAARMFNPAGDDATRSVNQTDALAAVVPIDPKPTPAPQ